MRALAVLTPVGDTSNACRLATAWVEVFDTATRRTRLLQRGQTGIR